MKRLSLHKRTLVGCFPEASHLSKAKWIRIQVHAKLENKSGHNALDQPDSCTLCLLRINLYHQESWNVFQINEEPHHLCYEGELKIIWTQTQHDCVSSVQMISSIENDLFFLPFAQVKVCWSCWLEALLFQITLRSVTCQLGWSQRWYIPSKYCDRYYSYCSCRPFSRLPSKTPKVRNT